MIASDEVMIAEWLGSHRVTVCPTAYAAAVTGAKPLRVHEGEAVDPVYEALRVRRQRATKAAIRARELAPQGGPGSKAPVMEGKLLRAAKARAGRSAKYAERLRRLTAKWESCRDLRGMAEQEGVGIKRMRYLLAEAGVRATIMTDTRRASDAQEG